VESADIYVIKRDRTYATVREIWDNAPDNMTDEQISAIYEKLEPLTDVDEAVKQAHIEDINQKYKSGVKKKVIPEGTTNIQEASSTVSTPICPKCGAKLVLRTAKKGANIGNQFYGCSNFPKCRYIQNLDE
jgi:predicted RNA-binding Zn-ribbon protein involved in translation (DUF1610 family)